MILNREIHHADNFPIHIAKHSGCLSFTPKHFAPKEPRFFFGFLGGKPPFTCFFATVHIGLMNRFHINRSFHGYC